MKVLKEGKLPSEKLYRAKCRYCATEMEFKDGEKSYEPGDIRDPREGGYHYVRCPLCKEQVESSRWQQVIDIEAIRDSVPR